MTASRRIAAAALPALVALALLLAARLLDRLGGALLAFGRPDWAALVLRDPAWRGTALYRAARWSEAADAFAAAGDPVSLYNRGNALARLGDLTAAIAAYDAALARDPDDGDAAANRALLLALLGPDGGLGPGGVGGEARRLTVSLAQPGSATEAATPQGAGDGAVGARAVERQGEAGLGARSPEAARRPQRGAARGTGGGSGGERGEAGSDDRGAGEAARDGARLEDGAAGRAERRQATAQWLATIADDARRTLRIRLAVEQARRAAAGTAAPPGADPW